MKKDTIISFLSMHNREKDMTTEPNLAFRRYRKKNTQLMRPYRDGESMSGVSITDGIEPVVGGMIAVSETDPNDVWYITPEFFNDNYEEVVI